MKTIYAYYESLQEFPQSEEFACSNAWKGSWEKQGWQCTMLNGTHAKNSSLYFKLVKKMMGLSSDLGTSSFSKTFARYTRWCALHAAGGGWMSDYDLVNVGFTPEIADQHEAASSILMISGEPAYLFYATQQHCASAISRFLSGEFFENGQKKDEADILGLPEGLEIVVPLVFHPKKTKETSKSLQMLDRLNGMGNSP